MAIYDDDNCMTVTIGERNGNLNIKKLYQHIIWQSVPSPCLIWEDPTMVLQGNENERDIHFYQEDELPSGSENVSFIFYIG